MEKENFESGPEFSGQEENLEAGTRVFWKDTKFLFLLTIFIGMGVATGWFLSNSSSGSILKTKTDRSRFSGQKVKAGEVYGREDDVFKDKAVGVIQRNENGEVGTHKLLREGGESQTAYLTSSVLDLDMFVGHKVEVWGQTFSSEKVGWLMDVGRVKVLE